MKAIESLAAQETYQESWIQRPYRALFCIVMMLILTSAIYVAVQVGAYTPFPDEPTNFTLLMIRFGVYRTYVILMLFSSFLGFAYGFRTSLGNQWVGYAVPFVPFFIALVMLITYLFSPNGDRLSQLDSIKHEGATYRLVHAIDLVPNLPPAPALHLYRCESGSCNGRMMPLGDIDSRLQVTNDTLQIVTNGNTLPINLNDDPHPQDDTPPIAGDNLTALQVTATFPVGYARDIAWRDDQLAVTTFNNDAWLFEADNLGNKTRLVGSNRVGKLSYSHDRQYVASQKLLGDVPIWDTRTGQRVDTIILNQERISDKAFDFHPTEATFAIANDDEGINLRELDTWQAVDSIFTPLPIIGMDYSPDGSQIAAQLLVEDEVLGRLRHIIVWDTQQQQRIGRATDLPMTSFIMQFSPDSERLAYTTEDVNDDGVFISGMLHLWHIADDSTLTIDSDTSISSIAFSPDGSLLAAGDAEGRVTFYDTQSGEVLHRLAVSAQSVTAIAFNTDGTRLAVGGFDGRLRFYQVSA